MVQVKVTVTGFTGYAVLIYYYNSNVEFYPTTPYQSLYSRVIFLASLNQYTPLLARREPCVGKCIK